MNGILSIIWTFFSDPVALTGIHMFYAVIIQLIVFYSILFLMLISFHIVNILDLKRSRFFHEAEAARNFANHMQLDMQRTLADFMDKSFNFMWRKDKGFTDAGMVHLLPKRLRTDIAMHMFAPMVEKSEILKTCFDPEELEVLASHVQIKHYFGNSFIISPKSMGTCMFYIVRGTVDIIDEEGDEPSILFTMSSGSLIGEADAFLPQFRREGVKTRYECDVLKLSNAAVTKAIDNDTEKIADILEIIKKRTEFGLTENAEAEEALDLSETSSTDFFADDQDDDTDTDTEVENATEVSHITHISPFAWLRFFRRNPKTLTAATEDAHEAKSTMEGFKQLPDATKKYNFAQIEPPPDHKWKYGVVSTNTQVFDTWNAVVFGVSLLYSYGLPICVMLNNETRTWWVDILVDLVNILDLLFKLFVFYRPSEMHHTVPQRLAHIKREFKNPWIAVSIVPVLPFHHIWRFAGTSYRSYLYIRLHLYIARLVTIHMYFRKWEHDVRNNLVFMRILKNTIYMSVYIVFFTCIFCSFGCIAYPNCEQIGGDTWLAQYLNIPTSPDDPVEDDNEFYYAFYLSLYWTVSTMFGVGYTNYLMLVQKKEVTLFIVHLVLSFILLTYFFADLESALFGHVDNVVSRLCTTASILTYLDDELTDLSIVEQVNTFMDLQWETLFGMDSPVQSGFLHVSRSMFKELLVAVVAETLSSAKFFQDMDPHVQKLFCGLCKINILPPNMCLMTEGEMVEGLYIIRRGYAEVYKGATDILVDILSVGQSFGDVELIYNQPSRVTIRAVTYVELICISKKDFAEVLATSDLHSSEVADLKSHPEAHEWFQEHFLVTESEWRNHQYVPPPLPPQFMRVYAFKGEPGIPPKEDPYLSLFHHSGLHWARYCLFPIGFVPTGEPVLLLNKIRAYVALLMLIFVPIVQANPYLKRDYMWIVNILDVFVFLDMIVQAYTGYFDRKTKGLITHPLMTMKRYLLGPFLLDLYGSPIIYTLIDRFLIAIAFDGASHKTRLVAYFLRMNRLVGTYRCVNYVKESYDDLTLKSKWKIAWLLSLFLIFQTHFFACITIVLACPTTVEELQKQDGICYPHTWITNGKHLRRMLAKNETILGSHVYLFSFYYTATTSVGCGFDDFKPVGMIEQNVAVLQLFIYIIVFTYVLAKFAASRSLFDYKLLKFQYHMKHLADWLNRENIQLALIRRILQHYDYCWMRTEGIQTQDFWPQLYPTLKKDAMYDTYEDVFRLVPDFDGIPRVCMREILSRVEVRYYLNHEVVVRIGDICQFIYIIGNGNMVVKLGSVPDFSDDDIIQLSEGGILGSIDPSVCYAVHDCTAVCWTNVDMFVIPREEFMSVLRKYPDVATSFVLAASRGKRRRTMKRNQTEGYKSSMNDYDPQNLNLTKESTLRPILRRELNAAISDQSVSKGKDSQSAKDPKYAARIQSRNLDEVLKEYAGVNAKEAKARRGTRKILASCLLPVSRNFILLDTLYFWAAVLSSGVTAFQFAFKRYEWAFWIIGFVTDAVYILKMILSFFITYYNEMTDLISNVSEIEHGYLSSYDGFIMDLFSSLPFELFTLIYKAVAPETPDKSKTAFLSWASLRLNRLFRLFFVIKHLSRMQRRAGVNVNLVFLKIQRLVITTIILLHWLVVIFYVSSVKFKDLEGDHCDSSSMRYTDNFHLNATTGFAPSSWKETKKETGHRLCYPYVMTLYFLVNTFMTTGYGDIFPITPAEIVFISLLAIASKVYVGLALMDVLSGIQYTSKSYHIAADATVSLYKNYGLPSNLIRRVKSCFKYAWQQNGGVVAPEFLYQAPEIHLLDICYNAYAHVLENSLLFRYLPLRFLKFVCTKLQTVWILSGDCIVKQHDVDDRLYFVHRGVIESRREVYDENGELETTALEYSMGSSFGEINGLLGTDKYLSTYTAKTNVDLVYLTHPQLKEIFEVFPAEKIEVLTRLRVNFEQYSENKHEAEDEEDEEELYFDET